MNKILITLLFVFLVGCDIDEHIRPTYSVVDAGFVVDADIIPTSFNESIKSTIKTTKGVFHIVGSPSVIIREKADIRDYSNGENYLCVQSWTKCRRIIW